MKGSPTIDWHGLKQRCNGMLPVAAYKHIHDLARRAPRGAVVEVGAAHGAATVAAALGIRDEDVNARVSAFEKISGGSRDRFGSFEENKRIIEKDLNYFGVRQIVDLHLGNVQEAKEKMKEIDSISLLILYADGRIDRDFEYFFDELVSGADVMIDDVADKVRIKKMKNGFQID